MPKRKLNIAETYVRDFGARAMAHLSDDISIATARCDWKLVLTLSSARQQIGRFE
ncbi:hypothetical protein [Sphingomonas nostoxanthinifaciens]|uniref:hypothetical protein n=1 Tax=Sphingomonas nostoxanthinifaciens TaxID=2872652 RepID=UPI001CC1D3C8|nr:hypothetical protein [Sphingomonas nostoxanthinifaciens]UAK23688.1 hypothetical protein K8P63_15050 [Sphingomonas nostoxanthinifaciens]